VKGKRRHENRNGSLVKESTTPEEQGSCYLLGHEEIQEGEKEDKSPTKSKKSYREKKKGEEPRVR